MNGSKTADHTQILNFIATCENPEQLRSTIVNARRENAADVEHAAFRKLISIVPSSRPGTVEHDFWQTIHAFEFVLTEERQKTTRLARTRQKVGRVGVVQTLADWALDTKQTKGFKMLMERAMPELTGEAIVLRHPEHFDSSVLASAKRRLELSSSASASYPNPKACVLQSLAPKGDAHSPFPFYTRPMELLPNALTIMRIALVPVFAIAFVLPGTTARLIAFFVFCIAGVSDVLDGLAARKLNAASSLGRMLDPIADKILVGVALMMLAAEGTVDEFNLTTGLASFLKLVPALIILAREILVSGLREFLAGADVSVPVSFLAKIKTAIQMIAIGAMILGPIANRIVPGAMALAYILLWVAAALTVYTGAAYMRAGIAHTRARA
jgi:cardiolipin synthase